MLRQTRSVALEAGYDVEGITRRILAVNGILTGELKHQVLEAIALCWCCDTLWLCILLHFSDNKMASETESKLRGTATIGAAAFWILLICHLV